MTIIIVIIIILGNEAEIKWLAWVKKVRSGRAEMIGKNSLPSKCVRKTEEVEREARSTVDAANTDDDRWRAKCQSACRMMNQPGRKLLPSHQLGTPLAHEIVAILNHLLLKRELCSTTFTTNNSHLCVSVYVKSNLKNCRILKKTIIKLAKCFVFQNKR